MLTKEKITHLPDDSKYNDALHTIFDYGKLVNLCQHAESETDN